MRVGWATHATARLTKLSHLAMWERQGALLKSCLAVPPATGPEHPCQPCQYGTPESWPQQMPFRARRTAVALLANGGRLGGPSPYKALRRAARSAGGLSTPGCLAAACGRPLQAVLSRAARSRCLRRDAKPCSWIRALPVEDSKAARLR
jgi:hypothetical protein